MNKESDASMNGEIEKEVEENEHTCSGPAQGVTDHDAGAAAEGAGQDTGEGAGFPPQAAVSRGGVPEAGSPKGGRLKGYFADHKLLLGLCMGAMAVMVIAGVFIAGYLVGRPCDGHTRDDLPLRSQPAIPDLRPDMRSAPSPERSGAGDGPYGLLKEHRDELEGAIAAAIGISVDELREGMEHGKTIAEIADEKGVSVDGLTDAVAAKIDEIADRMAADGDLTNERAEEIKSHSDDIASGLIERDRGPTPLPPGGGRG